MAILHAPSDPFACLYVIEIGRGRIKVGYTARARARLAQHHATAEAWGSRIGRQWVSPNGSGTYDREKALVDYCTRHAKNRYGREFFTGVTFRSAVWHAAELCGDQAWLRDAVAPAKERARYRGDHVRHEPCTINEVAAWLQIPRRQVRELISAGAIASIRNEAGEPVIPVDSLRAWFGNELVTE